MPAIGLFDAIYSARSLRRLKSDRCAGALLGGGVRRSHNNSGPMGRMFEKD